jgi:hypothetical protein
MKKLFTFLFVVICVLSVSAQAVGTLNVSVATSSAGGNYSPKNIVAIWIEDVDGHFVKTLLSYAQTYRTHLNIWQASTLAAGTEYNTVDAVTGPTKTSHGTRTCSWDATNYSGSVVPDGTYKLRMELTDKNATGNYSTFTFTKSSTAQTLNPSNVPSFSSIYAVWTPDLTAIPQEQTEDGYSIFPNPTDGLFKISGYNITEIEILNITGNFLRKAKASNGTVNSDISDLPSGIYFVRIKTPKGYITKKLFKN